MYPGYLTTIGQTKVSVVYTNEWQGNLGTIDALLHKAIIESIGFYSTLTPLPELVIVLGTQPKDNIELGALMPTPDGPCQIRSFKAWAIEEAVALTPDAMQTIAHEIYHCVQECFLRNRPGHSPSQWVIESSANYFSNLVFPKVNLEWDWAIEYYPDKPIWQHTYEASLFFQSLESTRGFAFVYLH